MKNEIKKTNRVAKARSAAYLLTEFIEPAIKEAEEAKAKAQEAIAQLEANQKRLDALADEALAKYPLL